MHNKYILEKTHGQNLPLASLGEAINQLGDTDNTPIGVFIIFPPKSIQLPGVLCARSIRRANLKDQVEL